MTWKRYDQGHRKAEILFNAFFALLFIV